MMLFTGKNGSTELAIRKQEIIRFRLFMEVDKLRTERISDFFYCQVYYAIKEEDALFFCIYEGGQYLDKISLFWKNIIENTSGICMKEVIEKISSKAREVAMKKRDSDAIIALYKAGIPIAESTSTVKDSPKKVEEISPKSEDVLKNRVPKFYEYPPKFCPSIFDKTMEFSEETIFSRPYRSEKKGEDTPERPASTKEGELPRRFDRVILRGGPAKGSETSPSLENSLPELFRGKSQEQPEDLPAGVLKGFPLPTRQPEDLPAEMQSGIILYKKDEKTGVENKMSVFYLPPEGVKKLKRSRIVVEEGWEVAATISILSLHHPEPLPLKYDYDLLAKIVVFQIKEFVSPNLDSLISQFGLNSKPE